MRKQLRRIAIVALAAAFIFTATSCDKEPDGLRPELAPLETMLMDFSDFSTRPAGTKGTEFTYDNFVFSYLTVGYWSISAAIVSTLPVAAYTHALTQTAEYLGDNTWEWSYNFNYNSLSYVATLTGERISNEEFTMEMIIIQPSLAPGNGVKMFDGVVRYDHTAADWTFYNEEGDALLEVTWNKDFETEAADLTYTYMEADQEETGSYIMWDYNPDEVFDAVYTISMSESMTYIEWNTGTIEGRVKAPVYFEDENWHCWDSLANGLADIDCE